MKMNATNWRPFSIMDLPPHGFVLTFVEFDEPHVIPAIHVAYYDVDGCWRTRYGRLRGNVTYWMPLPLAPKEKEKC